MNTPFFTPIPYVKNEKLTAESFFLTKMLFEGDAPRKHDPGL